MRVLYVIGYPGSGKSTAVRGAVRAVGAAKWLAVDEPVPHLRYYDDSGTDLSVWEVGRRRPEFSGTDALGMAINPRAIQWVLALDHEPGPDVLLGEGDRLANRRFFGAVLNLTVVLLDVPVEKARARAEDRARDLGREPQAESWWKGRVTKVDNLAAAYPVVRLDATRDPSAVSADLAALIGNL